jgi:hypothetical protein
MVMPQKIKALWVVVTLSDAAGRVNPAIASS